VASTPDLPEPAVHPRPGDWQHGAGVVWGFEPNLNEAEGELRLEPGLAIDACGRELHLDRPACIDLGKWFTARAEGLVAGDEGRVRLDAHVRIRFVGCRSERIYETVELELVPGLAATSVPAIDPAWFVLTELGGLTLRREHDGWVFESLASLGSRSRPTSVASSPLEDRLDARESGPRVIRSSVEISITELEFLVDRPLARESVAEAIELTAFVPGSGWQQLALTHVVASDGDRHVHAEHAPTPVGATWLRLRIDGTGGAPMLGASGWPLAGANDDPPTSNHAGRDFAHMHGWAPPAPRPGVDPRGMSAADRITNVAVLGAGTMGHGIAQVCAMAGCRTRLFDLQPGQVEAGLARIRANLDAGVARGKVDATARDEALARLDGSSDLAEAVRGANLVIEAVPEKLELKRELFGAVAAEVAADTVLGSNTSSLSIGDIALGLPNPGRVIGLHFFNPVHIMKLLEIVVASSTDPEVVECMRAFAGRIGKEPIVVKDAPGFATSRLGLVIGLEAIRMVEQGVASPEDIDKAMTLGYGFPMGPLRLTDLVGLDVRLSIAEYLSVQLEQGEHFRPPQLLRDMVAAGKLGKKSGQGFYEWK
jgi:3-hydroxybutyryl-CoA dehydrogenase